MGNQIGLVPTRVVPDPPLFKHNVHTTGRWQSATPRPLAARPMFAPQRAVPGAAVPARGAKLKPDVQWLRQRGLKLGMERVQFHRDLIKRTDGYTLQRGELEAYLQAAAPVRNGLYAMKEEDVLLEKIDPRHRPCTALQMLWWLYQELNADQSSIRFTDGTNSYEYLPNPYFFRWIEQDEEWIPFLLQLAYQKYDPPFVFGDDDNRAYANYKLQLERWPGQGQTAVKYKVGLGLIPHRVWKTAQGLLGWRYSIVSGDGVLLDTTDVPGTNLQTVHAYIWVLTPQDQFYTSPQNYGLFHHSSLAGGGPVAAAGEWKVVRGRIHFLTGQTGHYRCPMPALRTAVLKLQQVLNVPPNSFNVRLFRQTNGGAIETPAQEFLNNYDYCERNFRVWGR
jgi:hypothetical protein